MFYTRITCFLLLIWSCSCQSTTENALLMVPKGFPDVAFPEDNHPTEARIALGKKLFFDPSLSADGKVSCASCHIPAFAFADTTAKSTGAFGRKTFRNTPSLLNVAYQKNLFADGTVPALEFQVFSPLLDSHELHKDMGAIVDKFRQDSTYNEMAREAYHRDFDPLVLTFALASYQRTLFSGASKYDAFVQQERSLSALEQEGSALFETKCSSCHSGILFTDQEFHDIGTGNTKDNGRSRLTYRIADRGKFKTTGLRNVAITAPYLHDGRANSLADAVTAHKGEAFGRGIVLNSGEMEAIVRFLHTLTDEAFLPGEKTHFK